MDLEAEARKLNWSLEELIEEAKRLGWTPEYLIIHLKKESRIQQVIKSWKEQGEKE